MCTRPDLCLVPVAIVRPVRERPQRAQHARVVAHDVTVDRRPRHHRVSSRREAAGRLPVRQLVAAAPDLTEHASVGVAEVSAKYSVDERVDDAREVGEERRHEVRVRRHRARVRHHDLEELGHAERRHEDEE